MANRFTSTLVEAASAVWSPAGESILQLDAQDPNAQVEIMARVSNTAAWHRVGLLVNNREHFVRLPKFPYLQAVIVRNTDGKTITVTDDQ
ncbi:hypothetical protein B7L88_gp112 [Rhizobium phage RHEph10]|uniref:hypothetical protein n=1 Tax=Rhizobium phage RHEph10 TaxID=1220717 RepID=UPI0002AB715A|nr:hypothetical protein B7L88_gp112 [Rhizobium phage RHEph10]AGC36176.1 hypothetical protein RHEph10_gp133 [Rhizobium phage RHEph10]